jgi:hypothetical protein
MQAGLISINSRNNYYMGAIRRERGCQVAVLEANGGRMHYRDNPCLSEDGCWNSVTARNRQHWGDGCGCFKHTIRLLSTWTTWDHLELGSSRQSNILANICRQRISAYTKCRRMYIDVYNRRVTSLLSFINKSSRGFDLRCACRCSFLLRTN